MAYQAGREAEDRILSDPLGISLADSAAAIQQRALEQGVSLATAESCTGGLIGHAITANPGSSEWYLGGVISYADDTKLELLGVPVEMLRHHGAVSAQVAVAMAQGVRARLGADYGVAVTGVAGPGGGTAAKPVGLTYVAVAGSGRLECRRHTWHGDRTDNKEHSAAAALDLLREVLDGPDGAGT